MRSLPRVLSVLLLSGAALLGAGAVVHPVLTGDPAIDLGIIGRMPGWRTIHLLMLAGSGLLILGVWVRLTTARSTPPPLIAAVAVIVLGLSLNALNIAYMAGAGTHLAAMFRSGRGEVAAIFAATHPIGLVAARFGNFLVALGAALLGWVEWVDAEQPRWLAWLAWLAAAGGMLGVVFFDEESRMILAAVALLSGWEVATAVRAFGADRGKTRLEHA